MTIVEALKQGDASARVSYCSRWLFWDTAFVPDGEWVVLERPPHARTNRVLIRTAVEASAVRVLFEEGK